MVDDTEDVYSKYLESPSDQTAWMMTLADLLSLMLVFFILIYSMSSVKSGEWDNVSRSFGKAFKGASIVKKQDFSEENIVKQIDVKPGVNLDYWQIVLKEKIRNFPEIENKFDFVNMGDKISISVSQADLFKADSNDVADIYENMLSQLSPVFEQLSNKVEVVAVFNDVKGDILKRNVIRSAVIAQKISAYANNIKIDSFATSANKDKGNINKIQIVVLASLNDM